MNMMREAIDTTTLGWIKPELDETLRHARQDIEAFAENPSDTAAMRDCASHLHQVCGTLRMIELHAPAMVADEMEQLALALQQGRVADRDDACAALMRGVVQLPDYLERLQGGHRDIPIVLLPLLNELRAARGEAALDESALFLTDVDRAVPDSARAPAGDADASASLSALRAALAAWPDNAAAFDGGLAAALEALLSVAGPEPLRRMLWVALSAASALRDGALVPSSSLRSAFEGIEREARRLFSTPAREVHGNAGADPTRQLLFHVAGSTSRHPALDQLRSVFELALHRPTESELAHARGSLSGRNRALLDTVSAAVKEDLMRVKDALDLHLRTHQTDVAELGEQVEALTRVGETLGMMGVDVARSVVLQQRDTMQQVVSGQRPADETVLLDIAGALLYVDASLDDQVARLGLPEGRQDDRFSGESRKVLDLVVREAITNFGDARQAFVAFVETGWDHSQLAEVPRLLDEVAGALRILEMPVAAAYLAAVRRYTDTELLAQRRVPGGRQLDTLADALASIEYYLEAVRDLRPNRDDILEIARQSLEALRYWPLPGGAAEPTGAVDLEPSASSAGSETEELEPHVAAVEAGSTPESGHQAASTPDTAGVPAGPGPEVAAPAVPATAGLNAGIDAGFERNEDIDDEIREVFLEELEEEIANLGGMLPAWRAAPDDVTLQRPVRRVFHTLKGSGRLVGAKTLGEFSWKVENMLNRVLDGSRPASPAVLALVEQAYEALPQFHAALAGTGTLAIDVRAFEAVADRLAGGEEAFYTGADAPVQSRSTEEMASEGATAVAVEPEPSVPASVDPVLLEILTVEVNGHLATIEQWLASGKAADDRLQRAVHTLNGAFAMTEVPVITEITGPAEGYVKRLLAAGGVPTAEGRATFAEVADAIRRTLAALESPVPRVPLFSGLAARVVALCESLPDARIPMFVDDVEPAVMPIAVDFEPERAGFEPAEAERLEAERLEAERLEAERLEAERLEAERLEAERLEAERLEAERLEAERLEAERLEAERLEAERLEAERLEAERLEAERLEAERLEAERLEAERLEAERLEAERLEAERPEAEQLEAERPEAERLEAERLEAERLEAERLEAERLEAERQAEEERLEYARLEAEYAAAAEAGREAAAEPVARDVAAAATAAVEASEAPGHSAAVLPEYASIVDPDEPLDLTGLDPELVDIFVEEGSDLLDHSDGLLAQLREAPHEREPLVGLQRDLHTLKGGARMAGIMAVGELGHVMESLLEAVVGNRVELGVDAVPLLERGFDRLHAMVTRVGARQAIAMPHELIAEFEARSRGNAMRQHGPAPVAAKPVVDLKPLSAPLAEMPLGDEDEIGIRAPQEQVRIRADLLDRLVNYAGEVAIYRARLEQQLGAFRGAIAEMEATNTRIRDQLRRLEIETEAQILSRYQRENEAGDATFDPLELDRFSTLQQLSRALAESAADQVSLQTTLDELTRQYETLLLQQSRVSSDLQEGLMRTRMVPFDGLLPRLRRVVRQASAELGKQVALKLDGAQGELDRNVLERMTAPLEHMLRNSVAHGIEAPANREKAGKPAEGSIHIAIRREGSEIVLEVGDDGAGLNRNAIRRRAVERGLLREDAVLADSDLDALILEPGFSTADEVSRLAGRGVGMDVVASEVRQLGGTLDIQSFPGKGVRFTLRLPQTLAVTQAVFVKAGETTFAVPIASVRGVGRIAREELAQAHAEGRDAVYRYGDEDYVVHDLGLLLGQTVSRAEGHLQMPLLLIRAGELRAAVSVDQVMGNREIVVKPVGPQVASVPGIFGATIMGDGRVVVILDVAPLVRRQAALPRDQRITTPAPVVETRRVPLVMVVDDSVTMRKVTGRVLERNGFEVVTAKDGIDALERMAEVVPDLMLLDVEMPRMDGYELATAMKGEQRLRNVPIMMITSRTGEKHRQRAFDIGVNRYLGKPYQEPELMRNVHELLGMATVDA